MIQIAILTEKSDTIEVLSPDEELPRSSLVLNKGVVVPDTDTSRRADKVKKVINLLYVLYYI